MATRCCCPPESWAGRLLRWREIEIDDENLVIAPADGHIVVTEPTEEWEYFDGKKMIQVSIFMSVFSVHANWYPISGIVRYVLLVLNTIKLI